VSLTLQSLPAQVAESRRMPASVEKVEVRVSDLRPDVPAQLEAWPIRIAARGVSGYTLWVQGDPDRLLTIGGALVLFASPAGLHRAAQAGAVKPTAIAEATEPELWRIVHIPAVDYDLDEALRWFGAEDRDTSVDACAAALDCLNLATDIAATVSGGGAVPEISDALACAREALTFRTTFLGEGTTHQRDASEVERALTPSATVEAIRLLHSAARALVPAGS
jgi:hypothetical protein